MERGQIIARTLSVVRLTTASAITKFLGDPVGFFELTARDYGVWVLDASGPPASYLNMIYLPRDASMQIPIGEDLGGNQSLWYYLPSGASLYVRRLDFSTRTPVRR